MPPVALNLRRPGQNIEQWHVSAPPYRTRIEFGDESYPGLMHPAVLKMTVIRDTVHMMMDAWMNRKTIDVSLPGYMESKGQVTAIVVREPLDGYPEAEVTLALTGAPWKNLVAEAQDRAEFDLVRYSYPTIYGTPFLQPALEQMAKDVGAGLVKHFNDIHIGMPRAPKGTIARHLYAGDIESTIKFDARPMTEAMNELAKKLGGHYHLGIDWAKKEERVMKVRNRFYVAAPHVTTELEQAQDNLPGKVVFSEPIGSPCYVDAGSSFEGRQRGKHTSGKWTRKKLADAVKHAEQMLEADPQRDHVAIVQIVRVVRRKKAPVVVEVVR